MSLSVNRLIRKKLRRTRPDLHKGDLGRLFIVSGSRGLTGACRLASMAALRAGAGLVTVGAPRGLVKALTRSLREAMWIGLPETSAGSLSATALRPALGALKTRDVLAIGPGLSRHRSTMSFVRGFLTRADVPMVVDADALAAFQKKTSLFRTLAGRAVLTPHPGEFRGLFGLCPRTGQGRLRAARSAARRIKQVIVLKGHRTVVADPDGRSYVNRTGNPGMATGGSGDVLTGIIAAFLGQGMTPFEAAVSGVYVHGLAGDRAARKMGEVSLVAGDIIDALPDTIKRIVGKYTRETQRV